MTFGSRCALICFPVVTLLAVGCGGAADQSVDPGSSDQAATTERAVTASWVKGAERAFATQFKGVVAPTAATKSALHGAALATYKSWSSTVGNPITVLKWTSGGHTGYFLDQAYNGSDSEITALFDVHGNLLATRDAPNGETVWVHPDGTSDDPG